MTQVFSNSRTFLGKYAITADMSAVALNSSIDTLDKTAMGDATKKFKKGLFTTTANMEGYYSAGAGLISPILDETYFAVKDVPFTVIPVTLDLASNAENSRAYSFPADIATWESFGTIGEMMKFRATAEACGTKLIPGYIGFYGTKAAAAVTTSTPIEITGGAPAGYTVYGALQVFSATAGDTLDVKIQNDTLVGFGTPTDCITFTQVVGVAGYEWKSKAGGASYAENWWRIECTVVDAGGGGVSFTFACFFGIAPD
jgi:hypothetical protein